VSATAFHSRRHPEERLDVDEIPRCESSFAKDDRHPDLGLQFLTCLLSCLELVLAFLAVALGGLQAARGRRRRTPTMAIVIAPIALYNLSMCTVGDLGSEIAELAARLDAATHRLLTCIRQFDQSEEWAAQGAVSCAHWLGWRIGLDPGTAREKVRVARVLGQLPKLDEALRLGKLSYAKARALTRVATPANEDALLELALAATGAQLERICRAYRSAKSQDRPCQPEDRGVRRRDLPGGMVKLELVLSPDEADLVMRAVDCARAVSAEASKAEPDAKSDWPTQADGLVALAESFLAGNRPTGTAGDHYQVVVHVDQDPLAPDGSLAATLDDGSRVSAEVLRRVACDCGVVAVTGAPGTGMSVGRRTRSIPPAIRRALQLRDRGCAFPGCPHTRFLHGHHVRHWLHGGHTSVENMVLLCPHHHGLVHEGGWSVESSADGSWRFLSPTGTAAESPRMQAWGGQIMTWLREWAEKHEVDLGPDSNQPQWDGSKVDYDWAVGALMQEG
jgi:hypothetical protein